MLIHGYEIRGDWKNSQCGQTVTAEKKGKKYFIKKYQTPVAPINNGTLDKKTFEHNKKMFDDFVNLRKSINSTLRAISGPGGNIVVPDDEFIEGNQYVEASELIEGVIAEEDLEKVLSELPIDVKLLLMKTAAGALLSVHSKHIIHGDLKLKNVLLVKNASGNYVAKLIDFDSSYLETKKPEEIVGTIDYYSPELGRYADAEDERDELADTITTKTDIFSLGLIFHYYLSGSLPKPADLTEKLRKRQAKGKQIYCWVALNSGCSLEISKKIKEEKYISLIKDMLSVNPEKRPTAAEVLKRLRDDTPAFIVPTGFCDPWPEHEVKFDLAKIKSMGFVSMERSMLAGVKGYSLYRTDGSVRFFNKELLIGVKYADTKDADKSERSGLKTGRFAEPWKDHAIVFDHEMIRAKGYISSERKILGGVRGYSFVKEDGTTQFMRKEVAIIQKIARERIK